jgi:hypothetical protein
MAVADTLAAQQEALARYVQAYLQMAEISTASKQSSLSKSKFIYTTVFSLNAR